MRVVNLSRRSTRCVIALTVAHEGWFKLTDWFRDVKWEVVVDAWRRTCSYTAPNLWGSRSHSKSQKQNCPEILHLGIHTNIVRYKSRSSFTSLGFSHRELTSTCTAPLAGMSGRFNDAKDQGNWFPKWSSKLCGRRALIVQWVYGLLDHLNIRPPVLSINGWILWLMPMAASFRTFPNSPVYHCSHSFLRLVISWHPENLPHSEGRICEHLTKRPMSAKSIVFEVHVD